jgi:hypothetical protein
LGTKVVGVAVVVGAAVVVVAGRLVVVEGAAVVEVVLDGEVDDVEVDDVELDDVDEVDDVGAFVVVEVVAALDVEVVGPSVVAEGRLAVVVGSLVVVVDRATEPTVELSDPLEHADARPDTASAATIAAPTTAARRPQSEGAGGGGAGGRSACGTVILQV